MANIFDEITAEYDKPATVAPLMLTEQPSAKADSGLGGLGDVFKLIGAVQGLKKNDPEISKIIDEFDSDEGVEMNLPEVYKSFEKAIIRF